MTTAQVIETSVTNNSLSKDYLHPDDHAKQIFKLDCKHFGRKRHCNISFVQFVRVGKTVESCSLKFETTSKLATTVLIIEQMNVCHEI